MMAFASLLMGVAASLWLGRRSINLRDDDSCSRLLGSILLNAAALCVWAGCASDTNTLLLWLGHGLGGGLLVLLVNGIAGLRIHSTRPLQPVAGYITVMVLLALFGAATGMS